MPSATYIPARILTGGAERARRNVSTAQPPKAARNGRAPGEGRSEGAPAVKESRISKSESPRSTLGRAIDPGALTSVSASVEAISIEWENVYDASACNPFDKRRWNLT